MKIIRKAMEDEMILEFLKGEIQSARFQDKLNKIIHEFSLSKEIILNGDIKNIIENNTRRAIFKEFRGYPSQDMFERFPNISKWLYVKFDRNDLEKMNYINYSYWNELSNNTYRPLVAAERIRQGIEIFGVSNNPFFDGLQYLKNNKFPPVILITCNGKEYLIIEGHSRMTIYALKPEAFNGTWGYIGYCTPEELMQYDQRSSICKP